jgi:hypothetical protein
VPFDLAGMFQFTGTPASPLSLDPSTGQAVGGP